jgi:peptidoglycan/LPS O-acetylase OafA/YrhL
MIAPLQTKPPRREIELDFIRGIAILMVMEYHCFDDSLLAPVFHLLGLTSFGWIGVDVFFVLSGFLVGGLLVKEWRLSERVDSKRFLIRRGFKIWPQYYVYLILMLLSGHRALHELWGNLLNIQNYTDGIAHTWSLAVEEHAYLIIVFCLVIAARMRVRMRNLFFFFVMFAAAISLLRLYLSRLGLPIFSPTHTRVDGILEGVLLAMLYHYLPETFRRLQNQRWLWILSLGAVVIFLRLHLSGWVASSVQYDFANLMGVALLMLLYRHNEGKQRNFVYRFVAWVGVYSYGIYLWHVSVSSPVHAVGRHLPRAVDRVWEGVAPLVLGTVVGILFTKLVEFPALRVRDRLFPRQVDSAVGIPAEVEFEEQAQHPV